MNKSDTKCILILLVFIIICSVIFIHKIKNEKKYDEQLYSEIYNEYNEIFTDNNQINNNKNKLKDENIYIYTNTKGVSYRVIAEITIPKLEIKYPVITETTDEYLEISICKLAGGEPNEPGNLSLIGHNYENAQFFSKLDKLESRRYSKIKSKIWNRTNL